jgi:RNA polymerase primary sigma factor
MAQVLSRYSINACLLEEQADVVRDYVSLLKDNVQGEELLRGRFFMTSEEFCAEAEVISSLRGDLNELRNRMVETNLRLVVSLAQKFRNRGVLFNDLIQEGNLGLLRALKRFDFKLGHKFSTYAGWWIKHYILRAISEQSRVIRLPLHMIQALQNMNRAEQRFIQNEGREPENHELAALLEMPVARVSAMRKMAAQSISLQAPLSPDEEGGSLEDLIAPAEKSEPWRNYAKKILFDKLYEMLNTLPERERQIIIYRFGLYGEPALPLSEISARLKLSRERVRQLENKVMALLRTEEYLKFLDGLSHLDE